MNRFFWAAKFCINYRDFFFFCNFSKFKLNLSQIKLLVFSIIILIIDRTGLIFLFTRKAGRMSSALAVLQGWINQREEWAPGAMDVSLSRSMPKKSRMEWRRVSINHRRECSWVIEGKSRPIHRKDLQSKVMGSESMRLGSESFEHKPRSVPKTRPISSYTMQEGMPVALKGYAGEIKSLAVFKTAEASFSSVY